MGEKIKATAHAQMALNGTAGISLRGIAHELGVTAPAIYNYYPRLDDLITALIVDAFNALADAIETAEAAAESETCGPKILASCLAYREWAVAHPVDFQLIYGNPIPGYVAPAEITIPLARRPFDGLFRLFLQAYQSGELTIPPEYAPVPASITAHVETWLPQANNGFPDALLMHIDVGLGTHPRHGHAGVVRAPGSGRGGYGRLLPLRARGIHAAPRPEHDRRSADKHRWSRINGSHPCCTCVHPR